MTDALKTVHAVVTAHAPASTACALKGGGGSLSVDFGSKGFALFVILGPDVIHAFNKSGRHLEFSINDVIRGKIIHVAKMATKDESSVDFDFAVCSCKKEYFYFISRGIFSLCLYGYVIVTLKLSCKDIPGSMISRANES